MGNNKNLHDEIAKVAYELFENSGRLCGFEFEHWLTAERIVLERDAKAVEQEANNTIESTKRKKASGKTEAKILKTSKKSSESSSQPKTKKSPPKKKTK